MFTELSAHFPREAISWRAQSLTADGNKAMALAYIDARDVMNRLDAVCGQAMWQDAYVETASGRVICTISILCGNTWVSKSDGAGNTDVEADKGGISDAFKRAAVKWGVGRYLYNMPAPWVPCETYERGGKKQWKRWTADPWSFVKNAPAPVVAKPAPRVVPNNTNPEPTDPGGAEDLTAKWSAWAKTESSKIGQGEFDRAALAAWDADNRKYFTRCEKNAPGEFEILMTTIEMRHAALDAISVAA